MKMLTRIAAMTFAVALLAVACDQGPTSSTSTTDGLVSRFDSEPDGEPAFEEFEICKFGTSATFDIDVDDLSNGTGIDNSFSTTLDAGECEVVAAFGGEGAEVTVEETSATPDLVQATIIDESGTTSPSPVSNPYTDRIGGSLSDTGLRGVLVEFFNSPPSGGEGCTPGYWKQPHHFDSWTAPFDPSDPFSDHFEDAFPGVTLLDVLKQGGGGLKALGRHTVAALLNAASPDVSYDLSPAEVIAAFNDVFPGSKQEYNALKDEFEGFNEQGCPLN